MEKQTVPQLAEFMAGHLGVDLGRARSIARYAREAGYLSQKGHGRGGAEPTARDAAVLLLAFLTPCKPVEVPQALKGLERLKMDEYLDLTSLFIPNATAAHPTSIDDSPIAALARVINAITPRAQLSEDSSIEVERGPMGLSVLAKVVTVEPNDAPEPRKWTKAESVRFLPPLIKARHGQPHIRHVIAPIRGEFPISYRASVRPGALAGIAKFLQGK